MLFNFDWGAGGMAPSGYASDIVAWRPIGVGTFRDIPRWNLTLPYLAASCHVAHEASTEYLHMSLSAAAALAVP